jgi:POT family proton-dependent oligopeptide transporter
MTQHTLSHPRGVIFLSLVQMWESFSFFGMRALLVLYLISQLGFSAAQAFLLYTLYVAFVKVFAALGGYVADRFLGYKRAVLLGGVSIALGHILLTFSSISFLFYLGLGSIVCGSALFRVSLQAILGLLYEKGDSRREKGFTLLYVGMNLGGLLAAVLCGFVAHLYGWHVGFGLAAFGMVVSMVLFSCKIKTVLVSDIAKKAPLVISLLACICACAGVGTLLSYFQIVHSFALPLGILSLVLLLIKLGKSMTKQLLAALAAAFFLLISYFTAEELWGSLLMVFSEMHIARTVFGIEIPSAVIAAINPLTIILVGPFLGKFRSSLLVRLSLAFLCLSAAFFILYVASILSSPSILYLVFGLGSIALGELFIAPSVMSFASKAAPKERSGMMMGATTLAFSMGSLLSGEVTKISVNTSTIFLGIGSTALGIFLVLLSGSVMKAFRKIEWKRTLQSVSE